MQLLALGLNHTTAPVEVREQLAFSESEQRVALEQLVARCQLPEAALLSTCNRTEIYGVGESEQFSSIVDFIASSRTIEAADLRDHLYELTDADVATHLFRVACGIDSLVIGESQILGQVRHALEIAQGCGTARLLINELFQRALKIGKRARTETDIGRGRLSVSTATVELAGQIFDNFEGRTAMLIGAGEMIELTAQYLVDGGIGSFVVANRTFERAAELARRFQGKAIGLSEILKHLGGDVDILISSTASSDFIIDPPMVERAMSERRSRPLFLIDIAVPRDIDPAVRQLDNVFLFDIDDLQQVVESNRGARESEIRSVELLVDDERDQFQSWRKALGSGPLIRAINQRAEKLRSDELGRWRAKLAHLSDEDRETVEALLRGYANKLLHQPLVSIRELSSGADGYLHLDTVRRIFILDAEKES